MNTGYTYDIWNGKEVIGYYRTLFPLYGRYLIIPAVSELKALYNRKIEQIRVPITFLSTDDGITIHSKRVLDVRKKSKRQIDIIKGLNNIPGLYRCQDKKIGD